MCMTAQTSKEIGSVLDLQHKHFVEISGNTVNVYCCLIIAEDGVGAHLPF